MPSREMFFVVLNTSFLSYTLALCFFCVLEDVDREGFAATNFMHVLQYVKEAFSIGWHLFLPHFKEKSRKLYYFSTQQGVG